MHARGGAQRPTSKVARCPHARRREAIDRLRLPSADDLFPADRRRGDDGGANRNGVEAHAGRVHRGDGSDRTRGRRAADAAARGSPRHPGGPPRRGLGRAPSGPALAGAGRCDPARGRWDDHRADGSVSGVDPLLAVHDLRTEFATQDGVVHAVNGISYVLREGESLGLVGESGCGKSVSALSLMRLIPSPPGRVVGGEVLFNGRDLLKLNDEEMRRIRGNDIAMIFQDPMTSLNPVLTIGRQIGEALELHKGMDRRAARNRTIELLELVGIPSARTRVDDYPHQFSGGMRQRVMIAMAISCEPRVLIADEPTTALDV